MASCLPAADPHAPDQVAQALNHACHCRTLSQVDLQRQLDGDAGLAGLMQHIEQTRPHLFSATSVFVSQAMADQLHQAVSTLARVLASTPWPQAAVARAPEIARTAWGPSGVFMGYDFHLSAQGPRLIEINTNAGGALLNAVLARAHHACCEALDWAFKRDPALAQVERTFIDMFKAEWRSQRGDAPWRSIAIVDDAPEQQYLAPEFELARRLFEQHGLQAWVVDAAALVWQEGRLLYQGQPVDMVYNRLTDFYLSDPAHLALKQAHEAGAVVMTPHPHAHAVFADKRLLVDLSDEALLTARGVSAADRLVLGDVVPRTVVVTPERADELWAQRRQYFFKPTAGYGGKAAYRGDKLTKRVWGEILQGGFVAQALVPPSERAVAVDGTTSDLKFDLRAYAYGGQVQLMAARMYSGQTTNFRTPGGGFAPVIVLPD